jgi:glycosyltransferase involved in cell wall biosynthesis
MFNNRFIIIGPLPIRNRPESFGGATVLMQSFIDWLDFGFIFVQTNRYSGSFSGLLNFLKILMSLILNSRFYDVVMLNVSTRGFFSLVPLLIIWSKIFSKKILLRKFGGDLHYVYAKSSKLKKWMIRFCFKKSFRVYLETKESIEYFKGELGYEDKFIWFPNCRSAVNIIRKSSFEKKFVFIGKVSDSKGVLEYLEAARFFSTEYVFDVYGPIDSLSISLDELKGINFRYCGTLNPEDVLHKLSLYDVIVLPTYYNGEGYPGVLIEALSLGMPVISTNWRAIPELITHLEQGYLVAPRNVGELVDAIKHFNESNYLEYCKNALKRFELFDSEVVYKNILNDIKSL